MASLSSLLWPQSKAWRVPLQDELQMPGIWSRSPQLSLSPKARHRLPRHYPSTYWMVYSSTNQMVSGAVSTINFFLWEAFLGQHFDTVELQGGEPEPGDLFLFKLLSSTGPWCGAHVGVYCGDGEIIHFEGLKPEDSGGLRTYLSSWKGVVCKQGRRPLQRSRELWRVLRRRGGVDRAGLDRRVRAAMDTDPPPYHPTRNNCVHFALRLLDVGGSPDSVSLDLDLSRE